MIAVTPRTEAAALVISAVLGIWVLAAPGLLGLEGGARASHLVVGPVVTSLATIAFSRVVRPLVRLNVLLGGWLVVAPLLFPHGDGWLASLVAGALIAALALVPRGTPNRFGGGWLALVREPAPDEPMEVSR